MKKQHQIILLVILAIAVVLSLLDVKQKYKDWRKKIQYKKEEIQSKYVAVKEMLDANDYKVLDTSTKNSLQKLYTIEEIDEVLKKYENIDEVLNFFGTPNLTLLNSQTNEITYAYAYHKKLKPKDENGFGLIIVSKENKIINWDLGSKRFFTAQVKFHEVLERGMSEDKVKQLLGVPSNVCKFDNANSITYFYYFSKDDIYKDDDIFWVIGFTVEFKDHKVVYWGKIQSNTHSSLMDFM